MTHQVLILNGPNLNMLGTREPAIYGRASLDEIEAMCAACAARLDLSVDFRQSNDEGELVGWVQQAHHAGLVINAAAYSHTSIALLDALRLLDCPIVEVHLSNIHRREPFRHTSYVAQAARGTICGFGPHGYVLALEALHGILGED